MTNELVVTETTALIANRVNLEKARQFCQEVSFNPAVEICCLGLEQFVESCRRYGAASPRVSLVDCSAFVTMRAQKVAAAFAYDKDFEEAGFAIIG